MNYMRILFKMSKNKKWMYISDVHIPYNDMIATDKFLDALRKEKPEYLILGGDIVDFFKVSSHNNNPQEGTQLQFEIDEVNKFLTLLRKTVGKSTQIVYLEGNHENRFERYLIKNASDLVGLRALDIKTLLELDKNNIQWVKDTELYYIDDFLFRHGHELFGFSGVPGANAKKGINVYFDNYIQGHVHKANIIHVGNARRNFIGVENPCLCEIDPSYMKKASMWQQGWTIGEKDEEDKWQIKQVVL